MKSKLLFLTKVLIFFLTFPIACMLRACGVRVLSVNYQAIGHLAIEPDVCYRELKLSGKKRWVFLFPPSKFFKKTAASVANRFLLQCWSRYFWVISHDFLLFFLAPVLRSPVLSYKPSYFTLPHHEGFLEEKDVNTIYKRYNATFTLGRHEPLIRLKETDLQRGRAVLKGLGLPEGAWYVCFHCREKGYKTEESEKWASCRNATIDYVELALNEIISRGGWCIRMGSPQINPLPQNLRRYPQIIDYPHTIYRSDFMDIFLAATCKFFLGNNSGIAMAASVLGTPCIWANVVPLGTRSYFPRDLNIYKLMKSKTTGNLLSLKDSLHAELCYSISNYDYEMSQIELVENSPEEIYEVTKEMLDRLDDCKDPLPDEKELQRRFLDLLDHDSLHARAPARIGTAFLKKYLALCR